MTKRLPHVGGDLRSDLGSRQFSLIVKKKAGGIGWNDPAP